MNDHVAEPFRTILNDFAGAKPSLSNQRVTPKRPTNRDRFDALSVVHAKLEEAGVNIDIGQLDWACREVEQGLFERTLDRQYDYEQKRGSVK